MQVAVQCGFIEKKKKTTANYHASMGQSKHNSNNEEEISVESKHQIKRRALIKWSYAYELTKIQHLTCAGGLSNEHQV